MKQRINLIECYIDNDGRYLEICQILPSSTRYKYEYKDRTFATHGTLVVVILLTSTLTRVALSFNTRPPISCASTLCNESSQLNNHIVDRSNGMIDKLPRDLVSLRMDSNLAITRGGRKTLFQDRCVLPLQDATFYLLLYMRCNRILCTLGE